MLKLSCRLPPGRPRARVHQLRQPAGPDLPDEEDEVRGDPAEAKPTPASAGSDRKSCCQIF
jgi:hypothetical protein